MENNIPECAYDGGDCCSCTCDSSGAGDGTHVCERFACVDASAPCVDDDDITVDILEICAGAVGLGDGRCAIETNIPECRECPESVEQRPSAVRRGQLSFRRLWGHPPSFVGNPALLAACALLLLHTHHPTGCLIIASASTNSPFARSPLIAQDFFVLQSID